MNDIPTNLVKKTCAERTKIRLLENVKISKQFEERVVELVDVEAPNLWEHIKDEDLEACDDVYGKNRGRRSKGDTWWWNEEVKEVVSRRKDAHKAMCLNSTEENKWR